MNAKDSPRAPQGDATRRANDFEFVLGAGDKSLLEEEVKAMVAIPAAWHEAERPV